MTYFPEELKKYYENIEDDWQPSGDSAWKCTHKGTKTVVLIRRYFNVLVNYPETAVISIKTLQIWLDLLYHDNLLQLYCIYWRNNNDVYLVVEYMQTNLLAVVRAKMFEEIHIRYVTYQILRLFKHAHSAGVIFRDLRMRLFGLNNECIIKLMDFPQIIIEDDHFTDEPYDYGRNYDKWYQPPEQLLVREKEYTSAYDMWALGCLIAGMFNGEHLGLFPCTNQCDHLRQIVSAIGLPTDQDFIDIKTSLASFKYKADTDRPITLQSLKDICPNIPEDGLDLLKKLLQWSPKNRITADEALKHKFVADFYQFEVSRQPKITYPSGPLIGQLFAQINDQIHSKLHSPLITTALIAHNIARSSAALTLFPREIWLLIFRMLDQLNGMNDTMVHEQRATSVFNRYFNNNRNNTTNI